MKTHCQPEENKMSLTKEEVESASLGVIWSSNMSTDWTPQLWGSLVCT